MNSKKYPFLQNKLNDSSINLKNFNFLSEDDHSEEDDHSDYSLDMSFKFYNDQNLIQACKEKNLTEVKKLLDQGANPNITINGTITPMSSICMHQFPYNRHQKEIIFELLQHGAHYLYYINEYQINNVLILAAQNAWVDIIDFLVDHEIHIDRMYLPSNCTDLLVQLCNKYKWMNEKWNNIKKKLLKNK